MSSTNTDPNAVGVPDHVDDPTHPVHVEQAVYVYEAPVRCAMPSAKT